MSEPHHHHHPEKTLHAVELEKTLGIIQLACTERILFSNTHSVINNSLMLMTVMINVKEL